MLLVDAIYINSGGGAILLEILVNKLGEQKIKAFLLLDSRLKGKFKNKHKFDCVFLEASIIKRHLFYKKNKTTFAKILCFANVPPTVKMNCIVFTFFQNVLLLNKESFSISNKLKELFIKYFKYNTNYWIVQTNVVKNLLINELGLNREILILPFFSDRKFPSKTRMKNNSQSINFIYVSSGEPHKNHINLLNAFYKFNMSNPNVNLILTIEEKYTHLIKLVDFYISLGVKIVNFGFINSIENLYISADICIYPSFNESFGLGLIEAAQADLPIICTNRPYALEIITPACTFNPNNTDSIFNCLINFKSILNKKSELRIESQLIKIITLLKNDTYV
jgi:glycosyltransferase involved in cell wall biosynthesis